MTLNWSFEYNTQSDLQVNYSVTYLPPVSDLVLQLWVNGIRDLH